MNAINLNLDEIYKGKATMIKDNKFLSARQYIEPFIEKVDKMCQGNFVIKAQPANQISLTPQGDVDMEDIVFNKVWIQGILPRRSPADDIPFSINLIYALDTRKPLAKIFKCPLSDTCSNMYVFNPEHLNIQEIVPEAPLDYSFVDQVIPMPDDTKVRLRDLAMKSYTLDELKETLGIWVDRCIKTKYTNNFGTIKLSETLPIEVYKLIALDKESPYFAKKGIVSGVTIYNVFSDLITNDKGKDIINKFEKIHMVNNLINPVND